MLLPVWVQINYNDKVYMASSQDMQQIKKKLQLYNTSLHKILESCDFKLE